MKNVLLFFNKTMIVSLWVSGLRINFSFSPKNIFPEPTEIIHNTQARKVID